MAAVRSGGRCATIWAVVIAILHDGGRIVMVHRMDGARPGNDDIAIAKATTLRG